MVVAEEAMGAGVGAGVELVPELEPPPQPEINSAKDSRKRVGNWIVNFNAAYLEKNGYGRNPYPS